MCDDPEVWAFGFQPMRRRAWYTRLALLLGHVLTENELTSVVFLPAQCDQLLHAGLER